MTDSEQLLAEYTRNRSESAFREIVTRYLNLVYSSALRLVNGDTHRAEDVAQIVFSALAKKGGRIAARRHARRVAAPAHLFCGGQHYARRTPAP